MINGKKKCSVIIKSLKSGGKKPGNGNKIGIIIAFHGNLLWVFMLA